jgi:shikimate dehydrogenase
MRKGHAIYLKGYNTDVYGFSRSLQEWFVARGCPLPAQALVLGTGGASKAIIYALRRLNIEAHGISRHAGTDVYKTYTQLNAKDISDHQLIVNTTPLGMYPGPDECPDIPYQYITGTHFLYDLIYNPEETLFLNKGKERGAAVHNGMLMLHLQADKAWEIWGKTKDIKII